MSESGSHSMEGRAEEDGEGGGAEVEITEEDYKVMLVKHWKMRVSGWDLKEHDLGLNAKVRAHYSKKRRKQGLAHPMFDAGPPTATSFDAVDPEDCYRGGSDDDDDDNTAQSTSAGKKSRNGKLIGKKENPEDLPFGLDPHAHERRMAWASAMKIIPQRFRDMNKILAQQQMDAKKCVQMCQKRYRKDALASLKTSRDFAARAKKLAKEASMIWRRETAAAALASGNLSALPPELSKSRKETREALERKKAEEAERERIRQQKRINFLLTQTELFAHFIGQKMGGALSAEKDAEERREKSAGDLDKTETKQALATAQAALQSRTQTVQAFDEATDKEGKKLSRKSEQALVQSLDDAGLQHKDVAHANEVARIFQGSLKSYQKIGFNWLVGLYEQGLNGILADEMGLGKTVQTISLLSWLAEEKSIWGPFLVVAPTSTMHNWYAEMQRFCPQLKVIPYFGANPNERKLLRRLWANTVALGTVEAPFHVLVTNYKLVISDEKHFARVRWQYMVLDEAQAIKSSQSQRWRTLLGFNCRNRLLLTGTPIQNSMAELWALLHFIMPELFDSFSDFTDWFSKDIESSAEGKGGGMDQAQLRRLQLILQPFMLRRTKKDVLDELVQKTEIELRTPLSSRQKYYYDVLKRRVTSAAELLDRKMLSRDDKRLHSLMNLVMQFRKVCNHPEIFERRDFRSPFHFQVRNTTAYLAAPSDTLPVNVIDSNPVVLRLPRLVYHDAVANAYWSVANASAHTRACCVLLSPFTPHNLQQAMAGHAAYETAGGGLGFLGLLGLSAAEVAYLVWANAARRWMANADIKAREWARHCRFGKAEEEGEEGKELRMPGERWGGEGARPTIQWRMQGELLEAEWEGELVVSSTRRLHSMASDLRRCASLYVPPATAAPVSLHVCDPHFAYYHALAMQAPWARALLLGGMTAGEAAGHEREEQSSAAPRPASLDGACVPVQAPKRLLAAYYHWFDSSAVQVPDFIKMVTDAGKLRVLDQLLPRLKAEGHKVLMFCQMTKMMDILEDYFWFRKHSYLRLDGSASIADRRDMVNDFQSEDSGVFLFLLSTRAGGLGINLTAADTVIFYDSDWNPTMDAQAMDRAHRLGQKKQVTVYRLVSKNTVEERILHRAKQKDHIQQMVISGEKASGAFKGGAGSDFRATDFADLLFEEDEEEEVKPAAGKEAKEGGDGEKGGEEAKERVELGLEGVEAVAVKEEGGGKGKEGNEAAEGGEGGVGAGSNGVTVKKEEEKVKEEADVEVQVDQLGDWLKIGGKVEVEWGGEWWDAEVKALRENKGRKKGRVMIGYVGGDEEDEDEWVEVAYSGVIGWVSSRLREWEGGEEAHAAAAAAAAAAGGGGVAEEGAAGAGRAGGGGSAGGSTSGKGAEAQDAPRKRKVDSEEEGRLRVKQWVQASKSGLGAASSSTPAIIEDMDD